MYGSLVFSSTAAVLYLVTYVSSASAVMLEVQPGIDTEALGRRTLDWDPIGVDQWPIPGAPPPPRGAPVPVGCGAAGAPALCWLLEAQAVAAAAPNLANPAPQFDLTLRWQHLDGPHDPPSGTTDVDPNPAAPFAVTIGNRFQPPAGSPAVGMAGAFLDPHATAAGGGAGPDHADVFRYSLLIFPPGSGHVAAGAIALQGDHVEAAGFVQWSFISAVDGSITVSGSYPADGNRPIPIDHDATPNTLDVVAGVDAAGRGVNPDTGQPLGNFLLPSVPNGERPDDYEVTFTGSGPTSTTLAFIGGLAGDFYKIDLGIAIQSFVGLGEFIAPKFLNDTQELFVGIDLVQWLSFLTPFNLLDEFMFVDGLSPIFPGVLIGTTPVTFSSTEGFVTDSPYTGTVMTVGRIDGRVTVSEPASILLFLFGLIGLAILAARGRERSLGGHSAIMSTAA